MKIFINVKNILIFMTYVMFTNLKKLFTVLTVPVILTGNFISCFADEQIPINYCKPPIFSEEPQVFPDVDAPNHYVECLDDYIIELFEYSTKFPKHSQIVKEKIHKANSLADSLGAQLPYVQQVLNYKVPPACNIPKVSDDLSEYQYIKFGVCLMDRELNLSYQNSKLYDAQDLPMSDETRDLLFNKILEVNYNRLLQNQMIKMWNSEYDEKLSLKE